MKICIKTYNGELPSYLTVGKVYDCFHEKIHGINFYEIISDNGRLKSIIFDKCEHLNGGSWEVVE